MAHRARVAIPFNYDETWMGGTYYIQGLVSALNLLPPAEQPDVWMLSHGQQSFDFIREGTHYPRLHWMQPARLADVDGGNFPKIRWLSRIVPRLFQKAMHFDMVFPFPVDTKWKQTVCWIPDFQEKHLPQFFQEEELKYREQQHRYYIDNFRHILFSSDAARADFERFYPDAKVRTHVVRFAVFHERQPPMDVAAVRAKHGLPERFFYCPNQFWIHKNHALVIRALGELHAQGLDVTVAMSGKDHDPRAPGHVDKLRALAAELGVADHVKFLGFLPRDEQFALLGSAIAIVQPSLFEGWSTVIEDAKFFSQYVLASSLPVNREQIAVNAEFFDPHDPTELAGLLRRYAHDDPVKQRVDYAQAQRAFARSFMDVVRDVMKTPA